MVARPRIRCNTCAGCCRFPANSSSDAADALVCATLHAHGGLGRARYPSAGRRKSGRLTTLANAETGNHDPLPHHHCRSLLPPPATALSPLRRITEPDA